MSDGERLDEVPGKRLRYTESIDGMSVTIEADTAAEILELRRAIARDREPNHVRVRREQLAAQRGRAGGLDVRPSGVSVHPSATPEEVTAVKAEIEKTPGGRVIIGSPLRYPDDYRFEFVGGVEVPPGPAGEYDCPAPHVTGGT